MLIHRLTTESKKAAVALNDPNSLSSLTRGGCGGRGCQVLAGHLRSRQLRGHTEHIHSQKRTGDTEKWQSIHARALTGSSRGEAPSPPPPREGEFPSVRRKGRSLEREREREGGVKFILFYVFGAITHCGVSLAVTAYLQNVTDLSWARQRDDVPLAVSAGLATRGLQLRDIKKKKNYLHF